MWSARRRAVGAWASLCLALLIVIPTAGLAADPCANDYLDSKPPKINVATLKPDRYALCFTEFAVVYSGQTRTPLWSAEHLTKRQLKTPVPRKDAFHAEALLPKDKRSETADYLKSGYDMGHMTPANDASSAASEKQTFSLANMVPQAPRLNRGIWAQIEKASRALAVREGELFVVTGPIFGKKVVLLKGRVRIPVETFKAIYDPVTKQAAAYVAENDTSRQLRVLSIKSLSALIGIDVFPSLKASVKSKAFPVLGF